MRSRRWQAGVLSVVNVNLSSIAPRRYPFSKPLSHSRGLTPTSKALFRRITEKNISLWLSMSIQGCHLFSHVLMCPQTQSLSALHCCSHLLKCQRMSIQTAELHLWAELHEFLSSKEVASSRTTSYNPEGIGQAERCNGVIWKAVTRVWKLRTYHSRSGKISSLKCWFITPIVCWHLHSHQAGYTWARVH